MSAAYASQRQLATRGKDTTRKATHGSSIARLVDSSSAGACACGGGCPRCGRNASLQTKLQVSQPSDAFEREADHVADQVLRMPQSDSASKVTQIDTTPRVSRVALSPSASPQSVTPAVQDTLRNAGQPLDAATREFFEPRFGHDFSGVRIHATTQSAQSAQSVRARAYTVGNNIAFNDGQYSPHSTLGRRLLAHELTHVVQQSQGNHILQRSAYFDESPFDEESTESEESAFEDASSTEEAPEQEEPAIEGNGSEPATGKTMRIYAPNDPGWVDVLPMYTFFKFWEPTVLPHFLKVGVVAQHSYNPDLFWVNVKEGYYEGQDAMVHRNNLQDDPGSPGYAVTSFNAERLEFFYGGYGPIKTAAATTAKIPPSGIYDILVPDYPHKGGEQYGPYATTWFLVRGTGDKYLHPGFSSKGCTTIEIKIGDTTTWPDVWTYLIDARSSDGVVGKLSIYNPAADQQLFE